MSPLTPAKEAYNHMHYAQSVVRSKHPNLSTMLNFNQLYLEEPDWYTYFEFTSLTQEEGGERRMKTYFMRLTLTYNEPGSREIVKHTDYSIENVSGEGLLLSS